MHHKARFPNALFSTHLRPNSATLAIMLVLLFLIFLFLFLTVTAQPAQAQTATAGGAWTEKVLHNFNDNGTAPDPDALAVEFADHGAAFSVAP